MRIIYEVKQIVDAHIIKSHTRGRIKDMFANDIRDSILAELNPEKEEKVDESLFKVRFLKFIETFRFEDISLDWLNSFNIFMAQTSPSVNARNLHFRNLRAVFNNAIENEVTSQS